MRIALALVVCLTGPAMADAPFADFDDLQRALPAGWKVTFADSKSALVIARSQRVRAAGRHVANASYSNLPVKAPTDSPAFTLSVKFTLETKWTATQLAAAKTANDLIDRTLASLRAKYRLDDIETRKGRPLPSTSDEHKRVADHDAEFARVSALKKPLPRCTINNLSLFDDPGTSRTLALIVDPPIAMREAYAIVELVKRRCR